jgi:parallel beta-helix repeat protein
MRYCKHILGLLVCAVLIWASSFITADTWGRSFYVAIDGDDRNPGLEEEAFRTIKRGASVLKPGDILYVKAGTYEESLVDAVPGGESWSKPVTVAAFPGQTVTIRPPRGASRVLTFSTAESKYIVIDGFVLDGTNVSSDAIKITWSGEPKNAAGQIRIKNSDVKNARGQGILVTGSTGNEFINLQIHDNGMTNPNSQLHGIYIESDFNLIEDCRVYNHPGHGIHIYSGRSEKPDNNTVIGNTVHANGRAGIGVYFGNNNVVSNNTVYENHVGIIVATDDGVVSNNTVYENRDAGIIINAKRFIVSNNVVKGNSGHGIHLQPTSGTTWVSNNRVSSLKDDSGRAILNANVIETAKVR